MDEGYVTSIQKEDTIVVFGAAPRGGFRSRPGEVVQKTKTGYRANSGEGTRRVPRAAARAFENRATRSGNMKRKSRALAAGGKK